MAKKKTSTTRRRQSSSQSSILPFLILGGGILAFSSFSGGTINDVGSTPNNNTQGPPPDYATEPDKWRAFVEQLIAIGGTVAAVIAVFKNGGKSQAESSELLNLMNSRLGQNFNFGNNPWTNQSHGAGFPLQNSGLSFNSNTFPGSGIPGGTFGNNTFPNGGFGFGG